jgi:hypothetical protein
MTVLHARFTFMLSLEEWICLGGMAGEFGSIHPILIFHSFSSYFLPWMMEETLPLRVKKYSSLGYVKIFYLPRGGCGFFSIWFWFLDILNPVLISLGLPDCNLFEI